MSENIKRAIRKTGIALFICYLVLLFYFLFFSEDYGRVVEEGRAFRYNLIPFQEIQRFLHYAKQLGGSAVVVNILGNVLAFAPLGFLIPVIRPHLRSCWKVTLCGFLFSLTAETLQLITKVGIFDVDDLILNTLGTALGYVCYCLADRIRRRWVNG